MNKELVSYFKALSNPTRLRVFMHIVNESENFAPTSLKKESCVTEISKALRIPQPTVSNHLKVLKEVGLVRSLDVDTHCYQYIAKDAAKLLFDQSDYIYKQANRNPY